LRAVEAQQAAVGSPLQWLLRDQFRRQFKMKIFAFHGVADLGKGCIVGLL
jgi:hypothetical protein